MSKSRSIVLLGSLGLAVVLLAGWFLLLSPRMATAGDLNAQREAVEVANEQTRAKIVELEQMKADIDTVEAEAETLAARFTGTAEESALFDLIRDAARKAGIPERNISDVTAGVPVIGGGDGSVTVPQGTGTPTPAPAPTPATDANAAPAPASAPAPAAPTSQLASMSLDVTVTGTEEQMVRFLDALESMDRAYLVHAVTLGESEGRSMSATINGNMYLLPPLTHPDDLEAEDATAAE